MRVVELDAAWREKYENFVAGLPQNMIYYAWSYRAFLGELLDARATYLGAVDDAGGLRGVLPLLGKDGPMGTVYNSLPFFGSYGGVLADAPEAATALWNAYDELISHEGVAAATVVINPLVPQVMPVPWDYEDSRIGQFTELDFGSEDPETELMHRIDPTARRNVRSAERAGFQLGIENNNDALLQLADIHRENILAIGGRIKPDSFFSLLPKHFTAGKDFNLYTARKDGEMVAALLLFYGGRVVEYFMPGTRLKYRSEQPSALLLKQAMLDAASAGYAYWNWGGTWASQQGVLRFKRKWGAKDSIYRYCTRLINTEMLTCTSKQLLNDYGFFYTIPFSQLSKDAVS